MEKHNGPRRSGSCQMIPVTSGIIEIGLVSQVNCRCETEAGSFSPVGSCKRVG